MGKVTLGILGALGVVVSFGSMWLGAYVLDHLTFEDWQHFPASMTIISVCVFGGTGALYCFCELARRSNG